MSEHSNIAHFMTDLARCTPDEAISLYLEVAVNPVLCEWPLQVAVVMNCSLEICLTVDVPDGEIMSGSGNVIDNCASNIVTVVRHMPELRRSGIFQVHSRRSLCRKFLHFNWRS